jgi:hypothetical protein
MKKTYYHPIDLALNELMKPLFENLSSDPAPTKSRFYFNTVSNKVKYHNGAEWVFFIESTDTRLLDKRDPNSHVLATATGLGPEHTISGAVAGAVLRAMTGTSARFEKLFHSDLLEKGTNTHADIDAHIADAAKHFLINDVGNSTTEVFSASRVLQLLSSVSQAATGALIFRGGYDPTTNTPDILGGSTVKKGHTYVITAAGLFYTDTVSPGDMVIAQQDGSSTLAQWLVVNKNIPNIVDASTTDKGIIAIATDAEVIAGTNTSKAVTPKQLKGVVALTSDNIVKVVKLTLTDIGATSFSDNIKELLAVYVNNNPVTIDENTIQMFEITPDIIT